MRHDRHLRLNDWFCGAGGSTQGIATIPGVQPAHAANHWAKAVETHAANFPTVYHWKGDIRDLDVARLPYAELFWASPECTQWSRAKGQQRDYAVTDTALPGLEDPARPEEVERSRALMEEVPLYLEAMILRGKPVLAGVVENVVDIRDWTDWGRWRRQIEVLGYRTRLIALNSMHAQSVRAPRAPQSRDRLYLAYWHHTLSRDPDWDKWLRPAAWCPTCQERVKAVQVFKDPTRDMGRYRAQYVYRCPRVACRNQVIEPEFRPAYTAIDWTFPGARIGDRARPLAAKTVARIEAGIRKYARPAVVEAAGNTYDSANPAHPQHGQPDAYMRVWPVEQPLVTPPLLVPAGGTWNDTAMPVTAPMRTRTVRDAEAVVVPPLVMRHNTPRPGRDGGGYLSTPVTRALGALTTAGHQSLIVPPFIAELRGGGSVARPVAEAAPASGWDEWAALYAYDAGDLRSLARELPTQTTVEGDALVTGSALPSVEDCLFRMLEPDEIAAGMAFTTGYIILGNRRERVRQCGNAVTPPAAEVIVSALVEAITGEPLEVAA